MRSLFLGAKGDRHIKPREQRPTGALTTVVSP